MSSAMLAYIAERMEALEIPYAFMRYSGKPPDLYFVGEYMETPTTTFEENGHVETTLILRGYTKGDWRALEAAKEKIQAGLPQTTILENGSAAAVYYDSGMPVPTGDADIKSIKINVNIQEWKVK